MALLDAGKLPQALKKAQLGIKKFPKDSDYQAIAGFVLTEMKQYKRSIPHFLEASRMKPDDPQFAENLANALMQTGQISKALSYAEQMAEKFPRNKELARVIEEIQSQGKNWRSIIQSTTHKLETDPDNAKLLSKRAKAYGHIGFVEDSARDVSRAYDLAPENLGIAHQKAIDLHQSGDKEGMLAILNGILSVDPTYPPALFQLSSIVEKDKAGEFLDTLDASIKENEAAVSDLEFAKAQVISRTDGLNAALPQFALANGMQYETNPYDMGQEEQKFQLITELFTADAPQQRNDVMKKPVPVFVIGQPRSGTTLMEMMLSSDANIAGCGELILAADLSLGFRKGENEFDYQAARDFAEDFRSLMPPIPVDSIAFVDKMPHNYQRVGFLLSAFPNAKVINMLRDPRDVGLSKWIKRFPAGGMNYSTKLETIAHSANMYRRYMAHWDAVFGDQILTVKYEDLVADPKTYSQQVAAFCGIEWNEVMMHPEDNKKQVRTASIDQVRKKISTKSIGGWREVADHIQPMLDGFDPELWPEYDFS